MPPRRELGLYALTLAAIVGGFLHESILGGKVLSPGDVVFASASFAGDREGDYEPRNRLLMDPVLQFEPWLEFTRRELRAGRLPLWNPLAGCGTPHLANGQSALFDPFRLIAYLGSLPGAIAWMAFARLWVAGFGTFLLARSWGFGPAGRWLSGLSYPFCGFVTVWLLFPMGSVAVWLPWLFLASDRAIEGRRYGIPALAIVVGFLLLGGQVQAGAHMLLAAVIYLLWRLTSLIPRRSATARWSAGVALGIGLAAIAILPLAAYLTRSPVWADRNLERPSVIAISTPRVLDAATTAFPYIFGSQRRGHPNLGKALGVHNLNEAAGGFAGLATLLWLAPAAWGARCSMPRVRFLVAMAIFGALAAFDVFPVVNMIRAIPVLNVADSRRFTLWIAFSLVMLGGIGIDATIRSIGSRGWKVWTRSWVLLAALFAIAAVGVVVMGPRIRDHSLAHYAIAAKETPGADPAIFRERAERQARLTTTFIPRYYLAISSQLLTLSVLAEVLRRGHTRARYAVVVLTVADLIVFGYGLNPAIPRSENRPYPEVIAYLRREVPPPSRIIAVGAELPPNMLMRYGLSDARNYDSIEMASILKYFDGLFEPEKDRPSRTSRRTITWDGVTRSIDALRDAGVEAIVSVTSPPPGAFSRVDHVGRVWVARLDSRAPRAERRNPREIRVDLRGLRGQVGWTAETFDPGWTAEVDGKAVATHPHLGTFLASDVPSGSRQLIFRYDPFEVRVAGWISLTSLAGIVLITGVERTRRKTTVDCWNPVSRPVRIESDIIARQTLSPGTPST